MKPIFKLGTAGMIILSLFTSCNVLSTKEREYNKAVNDPAAAHLARPTKTQYNWQEMERAMFIQLDPATIQGREYDDGTTKMEDIKFEKLDVNEWCQVAKSWGAKEINFMLAHSGGFCMWPSKTTKYHIGNTAYKGGNGDVVKEFAAACREHGLKAGFYFWWPYVKEDPLNKNTVSYTRDIDAVNTKTDAIKVLHTRYNEIMDRLGSDLVTEIWLDQPIKASFGDLLAKRSPNAVLQMIGCQDPLPTIRWPGNEHGTVSDPCWSTLKKSSISQKAKGQYEADNNQVQSADDPDGDYWAPHEADAPLHGQNGTKFWHMRPGALKQRKSLDQLMNIYEKSVGRNSFIILNCAPQADGSIDPDDKKRYKEFGDEINRRFGNPVAVVEQVTGKEVILDLGGMKKIDYTDLWEDYRYGHRIREYTIEGFDGNKWFKLASGTAVGRRKIDPIKPVDVSKLRVRITKNVGTPLIRKFQVHFSKSTAVK